MVQIAKLKELEVRLDKNFYDDDQELHYNLIQEAFGFTEHHTTNLVIQSWRGRDMNAARDLFEMLLPAVSQYSIQTDPTCLKVKAVWWPHGLSGGAEFSGVGWAMPGKEALAWLKAIVRVRVKVGEAGVELLS